MLTVILIVIAVAVIGTLFFAYYISRPEPKNNVPGDYYPPQEEIDDDVKPVKPPKV